MFPSPTGGATLFEQAKLPTIVFANLQSGSGKSRNLLPHIERTFRMQGRDVQIRETSDSSDLELQARKAILDGVRVFFAMGGDGTLQGLVNAAYGTDVLLGVIPVGGGNDFARALGLPRDPIAALQKGLSGAPRNVDLVRVRTADARERLYLGGGGVGLDAEAAKHACGRYRNWPGRWRYMAATLHAFRMHRPSAIRAILNDDPQTLRRETLLLASVLNTPTFGSGIRLAPNARIDDGLLDLIFVEELSFGQLLRIVPGLLLSGKLEIPQLSRMQIKRVRLETETPRAFHGDGEILGPTPVEIEVVPNAVRILAPKVA